MARTQPAAYCKILTLLVPRELKLEHRNAVAGLSDEQLEASGRSSWAMSAGATASRGGRWTGLALPARFFERRSSFTTLSI